MKVFSFSGFPRNAFDLSKASTLLAIEMTGLGASYNPVPNPTTGQQVLNRIWSLAYSTAMLLDALMTAALDALKKFMLAASLKLERSNLRCTKLNRPLGGSLRLKQSRQKTQQSSSAACMEQ